VFIVLSPRSPDPLHRQVTDQIREAVAGGDIRPGDRLPSIREMAKDLDISIITVKRSYADLEREGLIVTRSGLGSFVAAVDLAYLRLDQLGEVRAELKSILERAGRFGISAADVAALITELEEERDDSAR
jgi:GntR family transcriptional regulator